MPCGHWATRETLWDCDAVLVLVVLEYFISIRVNMMRIFTASRCHSLVLLFLECTVLVNKQETRVNEVMRHYMRSTVDGLVSIIISSSSSSSSSHCVWRVVGENHHHSRRCSAHHWYLSRLTCLMTGKSLNHLTSTHIHIHTPFILVRSCYIHFIPLYLLIVLTLTCKIQPVVQ